MESKIEKIEVNSFTSVNDGVYLIIQKINEFNEFIDYLNSQDQGGEKTVCEGCGKAIISRFMQSYSRDDGLHYYCLSCNPETEDTPEEKEELTKEEWFMLKLAVNEIHNKGNGAYDEISRKIDRLSKLNKEEK